VKQLQNCGETKNVSEIGQAVMRHFNFLINLNCSATLEWF